MSKSTGSGPRPRRLGITGYPLSHTLSPLMQQAAIDFHGLPLVYEVWETPPEGLASVVQRLREDEYLGMNVTVPHKQAVLPLIDRMERRARRIGAVNTVLNQRGRLTGYNTDAEGFQRALEDDARFTIEGCQAVILGAGGAARAVAVTLAEAGAATVFITNRNVERGNALLRSLRRRRWDTKFESLPWEAGGPVLPKCKLVVNCTSVGMKNTPTEGQSPISIEQISSQALVCDLVYNPAETELLRLARLAGAATLGGLPMLVYQGVTAFEIWTDLEAPVELMRAKVQEALGQ